MNKPEPDFDSYLDEANVSLEILSIYVKDVKENECSQRAVNEYILESLIYLRDMIVAVKNEQDKN